VNSVLWPEHRTGLKPTAKRLFGESEGDAQVALNKWLAKNNKRFDLARPR
jgi:hypothetical protein